MLRKSQLFKNKYTCEIQVLSRLTYELKNQNKILQSSLKLIIILYAGEERGVEKTNIAVILAI